MASPTKRTWTIRYRKRRTAGKKRKNFLENRGSTMSSTLISKNIGKEKNGGICI
ncbi:MAG: hypothetical protein HYS16_01495 [Deltaproteobacteria bacterium]|nr:MAG: hypothetical protein HYS16_01495 [Deltaproteobacteria bacterium]